MKKPVTPDAAAAAKSAGLRYVNDSDPGITRKVSGKRIDYQDASSRAVKDPATLGRIKRLAIPPAWTEVWICPRDDGHIQATGRDARRRKQYRYHSDWRQARDETKYERMIAFGRALPHIRRRVARDLRRRGLGREKVLATLIRLLETTLVRVGNEEYARTNGSVGLSTMRDKHVSVKGGTMAFQFKGKSGVRHNIQLHDPLLAKTVRRIQELPGQELFQFVNEQGDVQDVKSDDVNEYLRQIAGEEFSAKDFRTWAGTVIAAIALRQFERFETKKQAKKNLVAAIQSVAERLGNTPAVCRKCYVHPVILDSYLDGATVDHILEKTEDVLAHDLAKLTGAEGAVLAFLQQQLKRRTKPSLLTSLQNSVAQAAQSRDLRPGLRARGASDGVSGGARSRRRKSPPSARRPRSG